MQMKKNMIIILILITIMSSSCNAKATSGIAAETPKPEKTATQPQVNPEEKLIDGPLKLAYEGKIDNLQVGVGNKLKDVIGQLGEPVELANFEGSSYVTYQNISFMLDKIVESTSDSADIMGIIASEGYELYGVKVGMTPDEIKKILGAAEQEYKDGEDEGDMWKLEYTCGEYKLTFFFIDKSSPSTSAYLSKL
jgi:uncharacterized protein involved in high-affinity Fe2+ transport